MGKEKLSVRCRGSSEKIEVVADVDRRKRAVKRVSIGKLGRIAKGADREGATFCSFCPAGKIRTASNVGERFQNSPG